MKKVILGSIIFGACALIGTGLHTMMPTSINDQVQKSVMEKAKIENLISGSELEDQLEDFENGPRNVNYAEDHALAVTDVLEVDDTEYLEREMGLEAQGVKWGYDEETEDGKKYKIIIEIDECDEFETTDTYYHELAHVIDAEFNMSFDMDQEMLNEAKNLFSDRSYLIDYTMHDDVEYFAAAYALCRLTPERVQEDAPKTWKYLNDAFNFEDFNEKF